MGIWSLHLKFDGDTTDYSAGILENATIKECVGARGKHAIQSCSVSIWDSILAAKIFNATKDIDAKICNGNTIVFEGVIRPYARLSAEMAHENPIELEVIDYTQILHCYVYTDLSDIDSVTQAVKDKCIETFTCSNIGVSELIEKLFGLTGITDRVKLVVPALSNKKKYFCLEAGKYIDDIISDLLFEYCLDYRFSPGTLTVFSTKVVDIDSKPIGASAEIGDFNLRFDVARDDMTEDGVSISYGDYKEGKFRIWTEDNRWDLDFWAGLTTIWTADYESGYYYNRDMHKTLDDYKSKVSWQFPESLRDKTVIGVANLEVKGELHDETGVEYSSHCDEYDKDGGKPYIKYSGVFNYTWGGKGWGFYMEVWASVFYRDSSLKYEKILGLNPTKVTALYIENVEEAKLLCANLQARNEKAVYSYSFSTKVDLIPGAIVRLDEDKVTGLVTDVRILSKTYNPLTKLFKYEAEGAGSVKIPEIFSSASGGSPVSEYPQVYFFELEASKSSFFVEEADSDFTVTARGTVFSQYGCVPQWSFNGAVQDETGLVLHLRKSLLKVGINTVECSTILNGQLHEKTVTVTLIHAALDMSNYYEWAVTPDMNPPAMREVFFAFDDNLFSFDDYFIVLDDTWSREQPDVSPTEFLWLRMLTEDGEYAVIRMTGNPYQDFSIYSDPSTYINSKRQTSDRTVTICVSYGNITNPVISYQLIGTPAGVVQVKENGVGTNVFKILAGQTPPSFTVQVAIIGIGVKTLTVQGIDVAENASMYLGRTTVMPPVRSDILLVDGDWVLFMGDDTEIYKKGHVYKKNGNTWSETTDVKELADVYWDTDDLRTQNIYARVLFADSILTENLSVLGKFRFQKTTGTNTASLEISEEGMIARFGATTIEDGNRPAIFNLDFDTGNLYGNFTEVIQYLPYIFQDSFDSNHPAYFDFYIPDGILEKVTMRVKCQPYRTYSSVGSDTSFELGFPKVSTMSQAILMKGHSHTFNGSASCSDGKHSHSVTVNSGSDTLTGSTGGLYGSLSDGEHSHSINVSGTTSVAENDWVWYEKVTGVQIDHYHNTKIAISEYDKPKSVTVSWSNGDDDYKQSIVVASGESSDLAINSTGWKTLKVVANSLGRVQAQLICKIRINTRML